MKNRYVIRAKISESQFRQLLRLYSLDLAAPRIALLTALNRNTVNRYLHEIRRRIAEYCDTRSPEGPNVTDLRNENCGSPPDDILVGLVNHEEKIYTEIVSDHSNALLQTLVQAEEGFAGVVSIRDFEGYDGLISVVTDRHAQINHASDQPFPEEMQSGKLLDFCEFARPRLKNVYTMDRSVVCLHLKECEFRFNHQHLDLYQRLLRLFREKPLFSS